MDFKGYKIDEVIECLKKECLKNKANENPYFEWLNNQENPPKSYMEHSFKSEDELNEMKKLFLKKFGFSLGLYIRLKRVAYLLENSKKGKSLFTYSYIETPIGQMISIFKGKKLCLLEFLERKMFETEINEMINKYDAVFEYKENEETKNLQKQLNEYFNGKRKEFNIPILLLGTEFQQKVWKVLQEIEYGTTVSYLEEAEKLNNPLAVRAVGTANGKNKISIIVPCHRVIQKNGDIGGYGGGVDRKRFLLSLESKNK